jgi:YegS/Rv2252/BmrU family lipid kinase
LSGGDAYPFLYVEVAVAGSLTIVVNPAAGGGRAIRHLPVVRTVLDAAGARYLICQSSSLGHARAVAAEAAVRGDLVVAFGGDGMAGAVASAVAGAKPGGDGVFGVIPAGRGNDLARTYGIPLAPADAARLLLAGEARPMDLVALAGAGGSQVTVAGSVYLGLASAAGQIANDTRLIRGPLVYPVAALRALAGWEPVTFHVDAAASAWTAGTVTAPQEFAGYGVVVANLPYFGAGMKVAPKADPGDGVLDIVLMRHAPKLAFLRVLAKIRKGAHIELDQIDTGRATAVTVTFDRPLKVGADGELFNLLSPLRISVLPEALSVVAPRVVTDLCTCSPPRGLTTMPPSGARVGCLAGGPWPRLQADRRWVVRLVVPPATGRAAVGFGVLALLVLGHAARRSLAEQDVSARPHQAALRLVAAAGLAALAAGVRLTPNHQ